MRDGVLVNAPYVEMSTFFLKTADSQATVVIDAGGKATGLVWRRSGLSVPVTKIA